MSSNPAIELASTLQSASLNLHPSPNHDINPSTSASEKVPVKLSHPHTHSGSSSTSLDRYAYEDSDGIDEDSDDEDDIPYDVLRPIPRRASFPPLPDLRFEQSYLASISHADTKWKVGLITVRDQLFMPLIQGLTWTLILSGWRHWNRAATLSGSSVGARVRRWWYETNNWGLPASIRDFGGNTKLAMDMGDVSWRYNGSECWGSAD